MNVPLPEPSQVIFLHQAPYTADQLLSYGKSCADAALEAAAQKLDAEHAQSKHLHNYAAFYARAIRAMKEGT